MVLSNYKGKNGHLVLNEKNKIQITPLSQFRGKELKPDQKIIFAKRMKSKKWIILEQIEILQDGTKLSQVLDLTTVWKKMMNFWGDGTPANDIEIFVTKASNKGKKSIIIPNGELEIDFKALPGVYLFPKESLQKVKVIKNNRAILLPIEKVQEFVEKAFETDNFTYIPNWFTCYASTRSVDLYLVQRAEYDRLNSAARN